jgi:hypothetical protein
MLSNINEVESLDIRAKVQTLQKIYLKKKMSEQPEEGETMGVEELKGFMESQMKMFEGMNTQISTMLDGFDEKIKELSNRVEDLKKKKEKSGM